jgi:YidC/Oxa1 family membrane protein insertase
VGATAPVKATARVGATAPVKATAPAKATARAERKPPAAGGPGAQPAGVPAGVPAWVTNLLPYLTAVFAAFLPLAAGLYLLTTTAWTLLERSLIRRILMPAPVLPAPAPVPLGAGAGKAAQSG